MTLLKLRVPFFADGFARNFMCGCTKFCGVHGRLSCALCLHRSSRTCSSSGASVCLCCEDFVKLTWPCQKAWISKSLKQCEMNQYQRTNNDDLPLLPEQLLAETCIFRRPHPVAWIVGTTIPLSMVHKDSGWMDDWSSDATCASRIKLSKGLRLKLRRGIIRQA
jgi:hypothetical protein